MLLQAGNIVLTIVFILLASIFLWLMLWLASRIVIGKDFASRKKIMLLLSAVLMVVVIPLVAGVIVDVIGLAGELMVVIRNAIYPQGHNYVTGLAPIISFLLFLLILKFLNGMEWKDTVWIALVAIFFLYLLFSLFPELDFMGAMSYT